MTIYEYVFGTDGPQQVHCCFHDDDRTSAGIGPNGEYNCFACGAKAGSDIGFIMKYFGVSQKKATSIKNTLEYADKYKVRENPITDEERIYLRGCGISESIINKYFVRSSAGKLLYMHKWNGLPIGSTWFNNPILTTYNMGEEKYKYQGVIGGMCTPYDDVTTHKTLIICEGEKDMLTAKSLGLNMAVAKVGGAITPLLGGVNFEGKTVIICYDCDDPGRQGAIKDASMLMDKYNCRVKVIDLGLQDKEDLNDYFIKYKHTVDEFKGLIKKTPWFVIPPEIKESKIDKLLKNLTADEIDELKKKLIGGTNE